jgi:hypothetical protein
VDDRTKIIFDALINAAEAAKHVLKQFEDASAKANESGPPPETPEGQSTEGEEASTNQPTATETPEGGDGASLQDYGCVLRMLPKRLLLQAASTAVKINPLNAPHVTGRTDGLSAAPVEPLHIALLTTKYWGPQQRQLTVSFMETTPADLRNRIISHMNAWNARCGISFVFTNGTGQVRISRGQGGYYSYLGTDILHIPAGRQTMNLQGFTMNTPESEYKRVVRHETGHCLVGDTLVDCPRDLKKYPLGIPIRDLVGQEPWVYGWQDGQPVVRKASRVWLSKRQTRVVRVKLRTGQGYYGKEFLPPLELVGTPDHLVLLADGKTWKPLGKLKRGDRLCSLYRSKNGQRSRIRWTGLEERVREHIFVCEQVYGPRPEGHDCHHVNSDMMDQTPENLEWKDEWQHAHDHASGREDTPETSARRSEAQRRREPPTAETRAKMAESQRNRPPISEETRAKISAGSKGRSQSEELRERKREAMARFYANGGTPPGLGKHPSKEARAKRSATMKATLARKKAARLAGTTVNNHIVVSVQLVNELMDVYDMTVPGADSFVANGVVVHNSLGSPHEHMRKELVALLDPQKTVAWFEKYQGWDAQTVQEQVLTPLDDASIMGTPTDQDSIMCYQLSGSITKNGQPIRGGVDINESDYAFMARIYPPPPGSGGDDLDWLV